MEQRYAYTESKETYISLLPEYKRLFEGRMSSADVQSYNEVLFSCQSCGIEGNSYSVDDSRALYELGLGSVPQGKTLMESMEMLDHFHAYESMVESVSQPLSEQLLKSLHRQLTEHTMSYLHEGAVPGEYTDTDMCAGDTVFGNHEKLIAQVPKLLEATERAINSDNPAMEVAARFHGFFEHLHPFRDGNGRIGRLMVNYILLRRDEPVLIIPMERRAEYINCLKAFRNDSQEYLIDFFYRVACERMQTELSERKKASGNMMFLF